MSYFVSFWACGIIPCLNSPSIFSLPVRLLSAYIMLHVAPLTRLEIILSGFVLLEKIPATPLN